MSVRVCVSVCVCVLLALWDDAGAVGHQQIHHRVPAHEHRGGRHHAAERDGAALAAAGARIAGGGVVGPHVALQLRGGLAVNAAQMADEHGPGA